DGAHGLWQITVRVENLTPGFTVEAARNDALRGAFLGTHLLLAAREGDFVSLTDPPAWATVAAAQCRNVGTYPALAGPPDRRDLVVCAPVILGDHPAIAPESPQDLFDSTEIDEILTLRTMTLTDEEKRAARATDPRAAELLDRLDHLPPEMLDRMHGAIRYLNPAGGPSGGPAAGPGTVPEWTEPPQEQPGDPGRPPHENGAACDPAVAGQAPWWDPGADRSVSPDTDHIMIGDVRVARGSRVRMRPGRRRADAQDLFLAGRTALVEAVLFDVDGHAHLALVPDDDPGADLQRSQGRFLYFAPDEVEPLGAVG
ncbi:MAG: hypothetical protein ACREOE_19825, partial [Gemmatimonadales bacterium]